MPTVRHAPLSEFGCCSSNLFISVSLRASGSLVKELPFTAKLDTRVAFFCEIPLATATPTWRFHTNPRHGRREGHNSTTTAPTTLRQEMYSGWSGLFFFADTTATSM